MPQCGPFSGFTLRSKINGFFQVEWDFWMNLALGLIPRGTSGADVHGPYGVCELTTLINRILNCTNPMPNHSSSLAWSIS